jgi:hypothetical protein
VKVWTVPVDGERGDPVDGMAKILPKLAKNRE